MTWVIGRTVRSKENRNKRHLLVDERWVPLSLDVAEANVHDVKNVISMVYGAVIDLPEVQQNLCLDNGCTGKKVRRIIESAGYIPHVRGRNVEQEKPIF